MIESETWGAYIRSVSLHILSLQPHPELKSPFLNVGICDVVGVEINPIVVWL